MPRMPRDIAASTRKNLRKRLRWSRSEMPMPSSETRISTTAAALAHAHRHRAAVGRVLDRVVDQVDQHLAHAVGVGVGERAAGRQRRARACACSERPPAQGATSRATAGDVDRRELRARPRPPRAASR